MNKREIDIALKKIAQGDNVAFEQLYIETKRGVYAFLFSYFNNQADCEDAMQTTYLKIKQNIGKYKIGSNGLAWILQIAKNTALNELRARANYEKQREGVLHQEVINYDNLEIKDTLIMIMKRILDEEEQRIVILHVVWGYKHKEIAKIINSPIGTVMSKYKRAADKLKSAWKEEQA
ncbi:MAG: RNA polymerase sigma factor [Acutalibacteraceae bacterium]